jgi:hypothetical protein
MLAIREGREVQRVGGPGDSRLHDETGRRLGRGGGEDGKLPAVGAANPEDDEAARRFGSEVVVRREGYSEDGGAGTRGWRCSAGSDEESDES